MAAAESRKTARGSGWPAAAGRRRRRDGQARPSPVDVAAHSGGRRPNLAGDRGGGTAGPGRPRNRSGGGWQRRVSPCRRRHAVVWVQQNPEASDDEQAEDDQEEEDEDEGGLLLQGQGRDGQDGAGQGGQCAAGTLSHPCTEWPKGPADLDTPPATERAARSNRSSPHPSTPGVYTAHVNPFCKSHCRGFLPTGNAGKFWFVALSTPSTGPLVTVAGVCLVFLLRV
ncbi:uncharacterized protein LOC128337123 isoform X1 [Hemicordylus capensis]|uniref:uncharacterized protein LOC128337123 isoform X1 n=1 Tax=Hemicordylus capensis TaxID=884348 RepID=UPI00230448FB|nr:uncharacterized protein LOC128337123 isoform X1 [Hemicordylus capensis]